METTGPKPLGRTAEATLRRLADGDLSFPLDWVALQHLKRLGFVEENSQSGWKITEEGRRAIRGRTS
jgi:ribosomal protein S19E (S16A)